MCKTQLRRYVKLPPRAVLAPGPGPSAEKGWNSPNKDWTIGGNHGISW